MDLVVAIHAAHDLNADTDTSVDTCTCTSIPIAVGVDLVSLLEMSTNDILNLLSEELPEKDLNNSSTYTMVSKIE